MRLKCGFTVKPAVPFAIKYHGAQKHQAKAMVTRIRMLPIKRSGPPQISIWASSGEGIDLNQPCPTTSFSADNIGKRALIVVVHDSGRVPNGGDFNRRRRQPGAAAARGGRGWRHVVIVPALQRLFLASSDQTPSVAGPAEPGAGP